MTPDIKGLVERLREDARTHEKVTQMMADDKTARNRAAEGVPNDGPGYMGVKAEHSHYWQAADALERLSTPPAVPATPVDFDNLRIGDLVTTVPMPSSDQMRVGEMALDDYYNGNKTEDVQAACAHIYRAMTALYAAPVPAHSDVRSATIEECAKVAEPWAGFYPLDEATETDLAIIKVRTEIASAIRALSTTAQSGDQK